MQAYKLLQFFDTLALYFNLRHVSQRETQTYVHVPKSREEDVTVTLAPKGNDTYVVTPFPFASDRVEARCAGRWFEARSDATDLAATLYRQPKAEQVHIFVRG
jgi:hypothetical protein